jgi:hypothetical protein
MKRSLLVFASTAGLLFLAGGQAAASPTQTPEVKWTYNFTPTQSFVQADSPGTGTVTFTNEPTKGASNSSDVVITNLRVSSTAPSGSPDTLNSNGAWKVGLTLTDSGSGNSTTMLFTGKLGGTFSANNSNVTNKFTGATSLTWTDPKSGDTFAVSLASYTPPGPPTASNAGSISAHVTVTPGSGHTSGGAPEPSTLVLSCLGLGFAGFSTWRKRRVAIRLA